MMGGGGGDDDHTLGRDGRPRRRTALVQQYSERQQGQLEKASLACCIICTLPLWEVLWRCVVRGTLDCWRFWGGEGRLKLLK